MTLSQQPKERNQGNGSVIALLPVRITVEYQKKRRKRNISVNQRTGPRLHITALGKSATGDCRWENIII